MKRRILQTAAVALQWPVIPFLLFVRFIPEAWARRAARPLGWIMRISARDRILKGVGRITKGEPLVPQESADFWKRHLQHLGESCIEPFYMLFASDETLKNRIAIEGEHHLETLLENGSGAILFINHLGSPGAIVAGLGIRGYDLTIAGNRIVATIAGEELPLDRLESLVQHMFQRGGVQRSLLGEGLPRQLAEALKRNAVFAMFVDFPVVTKHNHRFRLGQADLNVNLGPALLAVRHGAPVLTVTCIRCGLGTHRLRIHPPLNLPQGQDGLRSRSIELMRTAIQEFEQVFMEHPEQWWPWDWADISPREFTPKQPTN